MTNKKEKCLARIQESLAQLTTIKGAYAIQKDKQSIVLLHFVERAEQIAKASLLLDTLPTPLQILCRVLCEDFFLVCWICRSIKAAEEYERGVEAEVAKMMRACISNGWGILQNKHSKEPVTKEFMETEFLPKLKTLKTPRTNIGQIAQELGLLKVYDILYRGMSLELHGNTFGLPTPNGEGADYMALSAIDSVLDCFVLSVKLPRQPYEAHDILVRMRLVKLAKAHS